MQEYLPFIIVTLGFVLTTIFAFFECYYCSKRSQGPSSLSGSSTPPLRFQSRANYGARDDSPPTTMEGAAAAPAAARKPILQPRFMTERLQANNNLMPTRQYKGSMGDQTRRTVSLVWKDCCLHNLIFDRQYTPYPTEHHFSCLRLMFYFC